MVYSISQAALYLFWIQLGKDKTIVIVLLLFLLSLPLYSFPRNTVGGEKIALQNEANFLSVLQLSMEQVLSQLLFWYRM